MGIKDLVLLQIIFCIGLLSMPLFGVLRQSCTTSHKLVIGFHFSINPGMIW